MIKEIPISEIYESTKKYLQVPEIIKELLSLEGLIIFQQGRKAVRVGGQIWAIDTKGIDDQWWANILGIDEREFIRRQNQMRRKGKFMVCYYDGWHWIDKALAEIESDKAYKMRKSV